MAPARRTLGIAALALCAAGALVIAKAVLDVVAYVSSLTKWLDRMPHEALGAVINVVGIWALTRLGLALLGAAMFAGGMALRGRLGSATASYDRGL